MRKVKILRRLMAFWELFIGIGAVVGAVMMFIDPSGRMFGMESMLPMFRALPFAGTLMQNFIFPGIALLCVNGLTNIVAFVLLVRRNRFAPAAGTACGVLLMLWIGVQFYIFPLNFMSTIYFVFGIAEAVAGGLLIKHAKV